MKDNFTSKNKLLLAVLLGCASLFPWTEAADTNEVWVSATAAAGTGTFDNPFPATTRQQFDTLMGNLCANTNMTVHLFPGTYYTAGYFGGSPSGLWKVRSDTKIIGAGMNRTIVARDATVSATSDLKMFNAEGADRIEISDLTVDCNADTNSTVPYVAIIVNGNDCRISRVIAKRAFGTTLSQQYAESFALAMGKNNQTGTIFEDCIATNLLGDYINGFLLNGSFMLNRCRVYLPVPQSSTDPGLSGFNLGTVNNGSITHSYSSGGLYGLYNDSGAITNLTFSFNVITNVWVGFSAYSTNHVSGISVLYNQYSLTRVTNEIAGYGVSVSPRSTNVTCRNIRIIGNTFRFHDDNETLSPYSAAYGVNFGAYPELMENLFVADNVMPHTFNAGMDPDTLVASMANRGPDGRFLNILNGGLYLPKTVYGDWAHYVHLSDNYVVSTYSGATLYLAENTGHPGKEIVIGNESSGSITVSAWSPGTIAGGSITLPANQVARFISNGNGTWFKF